MAYIDPHLSNEDVIADSGRLSKKAIHRDKDRATAFDRQVLFSTGGTYNGTPDQVRTLATHVGRPVDTGDALRKRQEDQQAPDED